MKKRMLALLLAATLPLALTACGGDTSSGDKDEGSASSSASDSSAGENAGQGMEAMLEAAETEGFDQIEAACDDNILNAQDTYVGKIYRYTGLVRQISAENARIDAADTGYAVDVKLSTDELKQLSTATYVDIVGKISSLQGGNSSRVTIGMDEAYLVGDTFTVSGELLFGYLNDPSQGFDARDAIGKEEYWYVQVTDAETGTIYVLSDAIPVTHTEGERIRSLDFDGTALSSGDQITVTGKVRYGSYQHELYEIESLTKN